jgi:hypothetical protein
MKITREYLRRVIKEELERTLNEELKQGQNGGDIMLGRALLALQDKLPGDAASTMF